MVGFNKRFEGPLVAVLGGMLLLWAGGYGSRGDAAEAKVKVDDTSFKCITEMAKVRHFYVDNLLGNLAQTVAVANAGTGDYPVGSVVQLMPNEVMIKQEQGFSPATRDWEFFWIDVDKNGSKIYTRGFAEVNNRFGLNCFACHVKAQPEYDFICETEHGCDPIPVTKAMQFVARKQKVKEKTMQFQRITVDASQMGRGSVHPWLADPGGHRSRNGCRGDER